MSAINTSQSISASGIRQSRFSPDMNAKLKKFKLLTMEHKAGRLLSLDLRAALIPLRNEAEKLQNTDVGAKALYELTFKKIEEIEKSSGIHHKQIEEVRQSRFSEKMQSNLKKFQTIIKNKKIGRSTLAQCRNDLDTMQKAALVNFKTTRDKKEIELIKLLHENISRIDSQITKEKLKQINNFTGCFIDDEEQALAARMQKAETASPSVNSSRVILECPHETDCACRAPKAIDQASSSSALDAQSTLTLSDLKDLVALGEKVVKTHPEAQATLDKFKKQKDELAPEVPLEVSPASTRTPSPIELASESSVTSSDSDESPKSSSSVEGGSSFTEKVRAHTENEKPYVAAAKITADAARHAFEYFRSIASN